MATGSSVISFSSGAGEEIALWTENPQEPQHFHQTQVVQVFSGATVCQSLSWNTNNSLLACAPKKGSHVAILNYENKQISTTKQIDVKSLLETETDNVGKVSSCCFLGNGHQVLVGLTSPLVSLWDLDTNNVIRNYVGHSSGVTCVSRNNKDSYLVSGLEDGTLTLHKLSSSQPVTSLSTGENDNGANESVVCVHFSPSEQSMVGSCSTSGAVRLWSVESQRLLTTFSVSHSGGAYDISFSPYNRMLMASVGENTLIYLYDLIQRKIITQVSCPVPMSSVLLLRDGVTMIGGGTDGKLYFYNMRNCKDTSDIIEAHNKPITSLAALNTIKSRSNRKLPSKSQRKKVTIDSTKQSINEEGSPVLPLTSTLSKVDNVSPIPSSGIATPASFNRANLSGVFSPLETEISVSHFPNGSEIPAPVTTTVVVPVMSSSLPPPSLPPISYPFTPSPTGIISNGKSVLTETPINAQLSSSIASIFSPLDSNVTLTRPNSSVATPTLQSMHNSALPLSFHPKTLGASSESLETIQENSSTIPSDSTTIIKEHPPANSLFEGTSSLLVSTLPSQLQQPQIQSTPTVPLERSPKREASSLVSDSPVIKDPGQGPTTSLPSVQMQYLENLLRETQDEMIWNTHRDIGNLSVSMLRQFATLQNQMILALTAVSEKVDKLSEEVQQLRHQINHLTPKY